MWVVESAEATSTWLVNSASPLSASTSLPTWSTVHSKPP
ncbi:hypothetical protein L914_11413 [Phytophthora nicotianae]|uniref:Uncharacterized protein n=1 Tax=Phytophthora nicotianae TaxID=4792 RepID=W2N5P3_PHYNI|nr:hypothetical protein L914_11413 [Phytophthora nicotianae]